MSEDQAGNEGQTEEAAEQVEQRFHDETQEEQKGDERIGFGRRLGAFVLDAIFGSILGFVVAGAVGVGGPAPEVAEGADPAQAFLEALEGGGGWMAVIGLLYAMIEGVTGASPGKMILGIHIRLADATPAGLGQLIPRTLIKSVSNVVSLISGAVAVVAITYVGMVASLIVLVGCFLALSESKQALHDRILNTAVYNKEV
jgi:uncharacterized RDD family membrane protein YckC